MSVLKKCQINDGNFNCLYNPNEYNKLKKVYPWFTRETLQHFTRCFDIQIVKKRICDDSAFYWGYKKGSNNINFSKYSVKIAKINGIKYYRICGDILLYLVN
jgi:hypothetical protein